MTCLSFGRSASSWVERLPLGDGRLGVMVDGALPRTSYALNHEHAWSGGPGSEQRGAPILQHAPAELLSTARHAVSVGRPQDAVRALSQLQGRYSQAFMPLGELTVTHDGEAARELRRELDLATSIHTVSSATTRQTSIVSAPFGVLAILSSTPVRLGLSTPHHVVAESTDGVLEVHLRFPSDVPPPHERDQPAVVWDDTPGAASEAVIAALTTRQPDGEWLVLLAASTTFGGLGQDLRPLEEVRDEVHARLTAASTAGADQIFADGAHDHARLYNRARLEFTGAEPRRDTNERLETAFAAAGHPLATDPALAALLFDFGRYLAIASSRPGGLPANLQGIWNAEMRPPWSSNYTLNINTEMNYWSSHSTNLSETAVPLRDFVAALAARGAGTARDLYGAPGWVVHHNSDAWLFTSTVGHGEGDVRWSHWPMAGAWLVRALRDAVDFGAEEAASLWSIARGAAEFALSWHHVDGDGEWSTSPSTSPENTYLLNGEEVALDRMAAIDGQLLRDLFETVVFLAERLAIAGDPVADACAARLTVLPAQPSLTGDGRIREWAEDRVEADPHHRHLSHLYGLFPGPGPGRWDAESLEAAARTLEARGDESTGWSLVWKIALWARLRRPDKISDLLAIFFRDAESERGPEAGGLYPNLFAAHPPFQIDANLGFPGALVECILQSHLGIELLPALPSELATGAARGLVARPGIEVDLDWDAGELTRVRFRPSSRVAVAVRYRNRIIELELAGPTTLTRADFARGRSIG